MTNDPTRRRVVATGIGGLVMLGSLSGCLLGGGGGANTPDVGGDDSDGGGPPTLAPEVTFDYDYETDPAKVTVTHAGGDIMTSDTTEKFIVTVSGADVQKQWNLPVEPGDSKTLKGSDLPGSTVRLVWHPLEAAESRTLGTFRVPG